MHGVINVSSMAYQFAVAEGGLEIDNLNGERNYGPWSSYGQSKLANILFTNEMQDRALQIRGMVQFTCTCLTPRCGADGFGKICYWRREV